MSDFISNLVVAVAGLALGYYLSRWTRHREILYSKKVELYSDLVSQLVEFTSQQFFVEKPDPSNLREMIASYTQLQNSFHKANLFIPDKISKEIRSYFKPVNEKLSNMSTTFTTLSGLRKGETPEDLPFDKFKVIALEALDDLSEYPGPFTPLLNQIPALIASLKADLGIKVLDQKFYERAP